MIDLFLPGRDSEPEDYQARDSLRTLIEAHRILTSGDEDLFDRMRDLISYNQDCLEEIEAKLDSNGEGDDSLSFLDIAEDRTDTRTVGDFYARLNRSKREERAKNLTPIKGKY